MKHRTHTILTYTVLASFLMFISPSLFADTFYVSPQGDDKQAGTQEAPLKTISAAANKVKTIAAPSEIVILPGRYFEGINLANPPGVPADQIPTLTIRAQTPGTAILDGSSPTPNWEPMPDAPGVFIITGDFKRKTPPNIWETKRRVRYTPVADLAGVKRFPETCTIISPDKAAVHLSDEAAKDLTLVQVSKQTMGIYSTRDNLTIQGLVLENYLGWSWAAAININKGKNVVVEQCTVSNSFRGLIAFTDSVGTKFISCNLSDVGTGIYSAGKQAIVKDCTLLKVRDGFMVQLDPQDDSAIQYYTPATGGEVTGNVIDGFYYGIFLKSSGGTYTVTNNTVIGAFGATFNNTWGTGDPTVFKKNIFVDSLYALYMPPKAIPASAAFEDNIVWADKPGETLKPNLEQIAKLTSKTTNTFANPLFVNPAKGDYRVAHNSPAAAGIGAKPAAETDTVVDATPKAARMALMQLAQQVVIAQPAADAKPKTLYIAIDGKDDAARGQEDAPLASLPFALRQARAGDTIQLQPGIYNFPPVTIKGDGKTPLNLTIQAQAPNTVYLDGLKKVNDIIAIENASNVTLKNLNIRWFQANGVRILDSSNITIDHCSFLNHAWDGAYVVGYGVNAKNSPNCRLEFNVFARMETGMFLFHSPQAIVKNNSAAGTLYGGLSLIQSAKDTVVENNSFCFVGNDAIVISEASQDNFKSLKMDYNNLGNSVRTDDPPLTSKHSYFRSGKAIVQVTPKDYAAGTPATSSNRLTSMAQWKEYSGKDQHSICADPLWVDPANNQWDLEAKSPNIGAGRDGVTIGAFPVAGAAAPAAPAPAPTTTPAAK